MPSKKNTSRVGAYNKAKAGVQEFTAFDDGHWEMENPNDLKRAYKALSQAEKDEVKAAEEKAREDAVKAAKKASKEREQNAKKANDAQRR